MVFHNHLKSHRDLITPYEETRGAFISLALEKSRKASPFVEEAKALRVFASKATNPKDLIGISEIRNSLLTASGISDKAKNYLQENDKKEAIKGLIENFLEPSGKLFIDELVYRFLLTRGDSLGGKIRNLAGVLGEWKFSRALISTFSISGTDFEYLDSKTKRWIFYNPETDIEKHIKGLHWISHQNERTLIYNMTVPTVKKNVDICLLDCSPKEIIFGDNQESAHHKPGKYLALGELKGGIDPAGADEHWKTANSALGRIRTTFSAKNCYPQIFFIGAAIENAMAEEIYQHLNNGTLSNSANLTNENQIFSLCNWLIKL